jgi:broad specificity phosphatase PhoE
MLAMALRLFLVRHAETAWNRERRYQGWTDLPLTEAGRAQAEAAARALAEPPLAAVYSSPLQRALATAAVIAAPHGIQTILDPSFKEMRLGQWEGLTAAEVRERHPDLHRAWAESPHLATLPGGEPLEDVKRRVLAGLEGLREAHDGQAVCVVSHAVAIRIVVLEALGLGLDRLWSFQVSPGGISELEFREDWTALHRMNTLLHLGAAPAAR